MPPAQPSAYRDAAYTPAPSPNLSDNPGFPDRIFPESTYKSSPDANFPETSYSSAGYSDTSLPEPGYAQAPGQGAEYAGQNFGDASYPDASFPDAPDASFEAGDPAQGSYAQGGMAQPEPEPLHLEAPTAGYGVEASYEAQAYGNQDAELRPLPSHQALQAFDAPYDQPPHIALGPTELPRQQNFYEGEQADADFLDESQLAPAETVADKSRRFGMGRRSIVMVSSALLGAVALGGALAFAYKQSGGSADGTPPLVQADSSPVKQAPQDPGGKEFPNKNKLIYERLQNGDQPEAANIVPRQEELAMPAMPGGDQTAGVPGVAAADDPAGGPRRVKTMVVRPDGSVEAQPEGAAPMAQPAMPPAPQQVAAAVPGQEQMADPAAPVPVTVPVPAAAPAADPQPVAAIPAPLATPGTRDRYQASALIEEAITSSQLEGASTTRRVASEMLRSGRAPRDLGERMVVNMLATLRFLREVKPPLTPDMVVPPLATTDETRESLDGPEEGWLSPEQRRRRA